MNKCHVFYIYTLGAQWYFPNTWGSGGSMGWKAQKTLYSQLNKSVKHLKYNK